MRNKITIINNDNPLLLNIVENGKMMFIFQASAAFKIWHGIQPEVDDKVINLLSE